MADKLAYEYRRFTCEDNAACDELNALGIDGWKLIPNTINVAQGTHPTEDRRMTTFSGLLERCRDQAEVKKEKADAEAKAKKEADDKDKAAKDKADKLKADTDKAKADQTAGEATDKAKTPGAAAVPIAPVGTVPSPAVHIDGGVAGGPFIGGHKP